MTAQKETALGRNQGGHQAVCRAVNRIPDEGITTNDSRS